MKKNIKITYVKDPFYNKGNIDFLKKSIAELENGKIVRKTLEELNAKTNGI